VRISKNLYRINANSTITTPLLVIEGKNITVDFNGSELYGSNDKRKPNEFYGLAILVKKGSSNIIIKNANVHGYKVAILADSVYHLTVENCNLSYNWRQQLHSNRMREDISDWMSYHHNEKDEWLRYGAALYLKHCKNAIVKNNKVTGGQCALMMTSCENAEVFDNNFSFNSAIGIGMYASSHNKIYHNNLDWNVRGYSYGHYNRGQDSAGILVFEQCNENEFYYNSVTHSGDGFFLWAGQYTMDSGRGGCNNNIIFNNDFSYAPTNGVEVTFSSNEISKNIIHGCDNGVWGGYSYNTIISNNDFKNNRTGIAIEHGQHNHINGNSFDSENTGVRLWSNKTQDPNWGYAKYHDTRSAGYFMDVNKLTNVKVGFDIMRSDSITVAGTEFKEVKQKFKIGEAVTHLDTVSIEKKIDAVSHRSKYTARPAQKFSSGKDQIKMTEWGPYNFQYPILWLKDVDSTGIYHFEIIGPKGQMKLKKMQGFDIAGKIAAGQLINFLAKADSSIVTRFIEFEYNGPAFIDRLGKKHQGKNETITYSEFDPASTWNISWYKWDSLHDPNKDYNIFLSTFQQLPVLTATTKRPDYTWWGTIGKNLPSDSFATVAATTMNLPKGKYEISITADDLLKLFVDGKEVINAWDSKYVDYDENTNHPIVLQLEGKHDFKIIHAENGGLATLMFYIKPVD
ncbi:MAG: hypothetical protein JWN76_2857, partial [Chitinophagaceae bacterium]|nr:hypothetical protein [Chitinophagaceae bacterium]